jgi:hypothetical protein
MSKYKGMKPSTHICKCKKADYYAGSQRCMKCGGTKPKSRPLKR